MFGTAAGRRTMRFRELLRQGTNLSPLPSSAAFASALVLAGVLGSAPAAAQVVDIQNATTPVNIENADNCTGAADCIIISTIGAENTIDLLNSGSLTSTGGMGINTATSGADAHIAIENLGPIDSFGTGISAVTSSPDAVGGNGGNGDNATGGNGTDGADGFNGDDGGNGGNGGSGTGGNGGPGESVTAGNAGDVTIESGAPIESDDSGIAVSSTGGDATGGDGGDGGSGTGGNGGNGGDSIVAGGDGEDATAA